VNVCVFTGSNYGRRPTYSDAARSLGHSLGERGFGLIYGGASVGLMGVVADAALAAGGRVVGVLPKALADLELAHQGLTELHIVSSMHERKSTMAELSDCFIALPGGLGTLEETFEALTWAQLGFHDKPVGLLNTDGYFNDLLCFLDSMVAELFVKPVHRDMLIVAEDPRELIERMTRASVPRSSKWIDDPPVSPTSATVMTQRRST